MARTLIAALWLASSAIVAAAQTGTGTSGTPGTSGPSGTPGASSTPSASGDGTTTGAGRLGPGGVPLAPGPSGANIPGQQTGPGGGPVAPGSAEDRGFGVPPVPPGETRGSGRPRTARPDCPPSGSAAADSGGLGPPARIMADEPGRAGQSRGADARATGGPPPTEAETTGVGSSTDVRC